MITNIGRKESEKMGRSGDQQKRRLEMAGTKKTYAFKVVFLYRIDS
jgi:hypothetical protein